MTPLLYDLTAFVFSAVWKETRKPENVYLINLSHPAMARPFVSRKAGRKLQEIDASQGSARIGYLSSSCASWSTGLAMCCRRHCHFCHLTIRFDMLASSPKEFDPMAQIFGLRSCSILRRSSTSVSSPYWFG